MMIVTMQPMLALSTVMTCFLRIETFSKEKSQQNNLLSTGKVRSAVEYGYEEDLSLDASEIFSRYEEYKAAKRLEKLNA